MCEKFWIMNKKLLIVVTFEGPLNRERDAYLQLSIFLIQSVLNAYFTHTRIHTYTNTSRNSSCYIMYVFSISDLVKIKMSGI